MFKFWQAYAKQQKRSRPLVILSILASTTLAVGVVGLASYQVLRDLILQQLKEKALLQVQQGIDEIDLWLATRKAEVQTLANTPTLSLMEWEAAESYLKSEVARLDEYQHFTFANPDGTFFTTKVGYAKGKTVRDRVWLKKSMAGQVYVSDPIISKTTGSVQVVVSAPIGDRVGVLGGAIKIERLDRVVGKLKQGPDSYAFALNSEGRAIVHPDTKLRGTAEKPAVSLLEVKDVNLAAIALKMVQQQQGIELRQIDSKWQYIAYAPLKQANWSVALAIPRENLESQLGALNVLASVLGALLAIATIGAWRQVQLLEKTQQQVKLLAEQASDLKVALTELKQTQMHLVQSEKMSSLGQMVAGIAHEINNPVNFIYGNLPHANESVQNLMQLTKLYKAALPNLPSYIGDFEEKIEWEFIQQDLPQMLSSMKIGAERIRQIVLSLRNFSRLDEADKKEVDLHEGIDNTLLLLQHQLKENKIKLVKQYGILPLVGCYPSQINQVFMNLLSNAIDALGNYPKPEKQIVITTQLIEKTEKLLARVAIADNGPGIPAEIQSKIFDPFFTTKPIGKGTGLGLAISYQIVVEVHQGRIWIQTSPTGGAEFIVEFPIDSPDTIPQLSHPHRSEKRFFS